MDHDDITCERFIRTLAEYLAGELDSREIDRSRLHLAACADCASYVENYQAAIRLARDAARSPADGEPGAATPLPEHLVQSILSARRRPH